MLYSKSNSKFFSAIPEDQAFASELFEIKMVISSFIESKQIDERDARNLNINIEKIAQGSDVSAKDTAVQLLTGGKLHALNLGEAFEPLASKFDSSIEYLSSSRTEEVSSSVAKVPVY